MSTPAMDDYTHHRERAVELLGAAGELYPEDQMKPVLVTNAAVHAQLASAAATLVQAEEVAQLRELLDSRFAELSSGVEDATEAIVDLAGATDRTGAAIDGQVQP